jgi:hypothetical protein
MTQMNLKILTIDQLIDRFAEIAIAQEKAGDDLVGRLWDSNGEDTDTSEVDRLYDDMEKIDEELRVRGKDARLALTRLYNHKNTQVRLKAAVRSLGVAPVEARKVIEQISRSDLYPQAGDAGMTLVNLERGIFKPD